MEVIKKLEAWVTKHYDQYVTGWTAERSMGNCDDCFSDGFESGQS